LLSLERKFFPGVSVHSGTFPLKPLSPNLFYKKEPLEDTLTGIRIEQ
jgi:hypothetical protein